MVGFAFGLIVAAVVFGFKLFVIGVVILILVDLNSQKPPDKT